MMKSSKGNAAAMDIFADVIESKFISGIFEPLMPAFNGVSPSSKQGKKLAGQRAKMVGLIRDIYVRWFLSCAEENRHGIRSMIERGMNADERAALADEAETAIKRALLFEAQQGPIEYGLHR